MTKSQLKSPLIRIVNDFYVIFPVSLKRVQGLNIEALPGHIWNSQTLFTIYFDLKSIRHEKKTLKIKVIEIHKFLSYLQKITL